MPNIICYIIHNSQNAEYMKCTQLINPQQKGTLSLATTWMVLTHGMLRAERNLDKLVLKHQSSIDRARLGGGVNKC